MRYTNHVEKERSYVSGFSSIGITAVLSIFVLIATIGWQIKQMVQEKNAVTSYVASSAPGSTEKVEANAAKSYTGDATSPGESSLGSTILGGIVSRYTALQDQGLYTEDVGESVAKKMAEALSPIVPYRTYTSSDVKTDADTSASRLQRYSDDLRVSLAPLRINTQPEFEIFAYYIDTKDGKYLARLKEVAQYYRDAASATARVVVPADAVIQHVAILNAMEEFAAMLDALAANATDPYASVAFLRTYNQAESDMYLSFKALVAYYKQKNT